MKHPFFPQRPASKPIIYAYSDTRFPHMLKVGYTERSIEERMKEHYPTLPPSQSWKVELVESAMKADGTAIFMELQDAFWKNLRLISACKKDGRKARSSSYF